jgi:hypothetical protein
MARTIGSDFIETLPPRLPLLHRLREIASVELVASRDLPAAADVAGVAILVEANQDFPHARLLVHDD